MSSGKPINSRRRWFRFSLASFLIAVTAFCALLGYIVNRAQRQQSVVALVRRANGEVWYDHGAERMSGVRPKTLPVIGDFLGVDYSRCVLEIHAQRDFDSQLRASRLDDADVAK